MDYVKTFVFNDIRNIKRDSLLIYLLLIPWLLVFLIRLIVPWLTEWLLSAYQFDLTTYYSLILSFYIVLEIPLVFGLIFGIMLLDEKDDGVLMALRVTPVSLERYILYRFFTTSVLSVLYVMLTLPASGLFEIRYMIEVLPVAILGGILSVVVLLFLIAYANNKVEGLAIMKGMGILMVGPLASYFITSKWQLLLGILPSYWPAKAFWLMNQGKNYLIYIIVGIIYMSILFAFLLKKFKLKVGTGS